MPRSIGTFNFSSNFETLIQGPLDARLVVPTLSDLTTTSIGAIPYPYLGMIVSVTSDGTSTNNGVYILSAFPATNISNWTKLGSGTGSVTSVGGGTGITIGGTATAPTVAVDTNVIATQAYVNTSTVGLLEDRGNYSPTAGNAGLYPGSGGSGAGGTIAKGDVWYITASGTMGTESVVAGDTVRALQNFAVGFNRALDTGWAVINSSGFTPTLAQVTTAGNSTTNGITVGSVSSTGNIQIKGSTNSFNSIFSSSVLSANRTYTLPNASGTLALTTDISSTLTGYVPYSGASGSVTLGAYNLSATKLVAISNGQYGGGWSIYDSTISTEPYFTITDPKDNPRILISGVQGSSAFENAIIVQGSANSSTQKSKLLFTSSATDYTYTFPNQTGTVALTSQIPSAAALSTANDTNITITAGGSASTALLQPITLTVGWTGTLADGRIASASTWNSKQAGSANLTSLSALSFSTTAFVKMTGANTFTLDTNTYATASSLSSYALTSSLANYVPYTGASSNVNLGIRNLTADTITSFISGSFRSILGYENVSGQYRGQLSLRTLNASTVSLAPIDPVSPTTVSLLLPNTSGTLLTTVATSTGNLSTGTDGKVTIPDASASARGLISADPQTIAGAKTFNNALTVNSTISATGIITGAAFYGLSQTGTNTAASTLAIYGNRGTGSGAGGDIGIYTSDAGSTGTTLHSISLKVVVKGTTGNVGIGTTDPGTYKLYVVGAAGFSTDLTILNSAKLILSQPSIYIKPETVSGSVVDMGFYTNTTERLRIKQDGSVGIGTATPDPSAILQVNSTAKGFLPPRMTQAQREAISSPAEGLMVFQTNNGAALYMYANGKWVIVQTL